MHATRRLPAPVVTLLSPSAVASQKAQTILQNLVGLKPVRLSLPSADDKLNVAFESALPMFSRQWHSSASQCPTSGSILHFLSMGDETERQGPFSMIGLTESVAGSVETSVQYFRDLLSGHISSRSTAIKLNESMGKAVSPLGLLKSISTGGLPLLELSSACNSLDRSRDVSTKNDSRTSGLKEIVVPYFDYAKFGDGSTLLSRISDAALERPAIGVYRWQKSSTYIRPLPSAGEDQSLPPPTFIFGCESLSKSILEKEQMGLKVAKIGYSGNKIGQLMMLHEDIQGVDIRYCSETKATSAFCEAQESLLAASLEELQSVNALLGDGQESNHDQRIGQADCWVEVRANLKRPSGFFHRTEGGSSKPRIAKIPDIPYE